MSDEQELREVLETNFRLSILYTRQVGERLSRRMNGLADQMHEMAREMRGDFDGLADRQTETLDVLRKLGDSSVDIRKEIEDLKRRVSDLENEDKAS